ncbi:MAG: hypothetical protein E7482_00530 [Ruminococcaceae bacterium]|nr:hypothetical protein [Oscillospiraceae bacterium]
MKKLICLLLVFTMLFCGCSRWKVEIVDPTKPTESESEAETSSEQEGVLEELTPNQKRADKYIFEYEFRHNEWAEELSERGISVSIEERKYTGDETWEAELVLKKGEAELRIPFEGIYAPIGTVYWGAVMFLDSKTAVFCGNKRAIFFSTENLETMDFEPELPDYGKEKIWINGAGVDKKTGNKVLFAIPMNVFQTEDESVRILTFDENGKFISERESNLRGMVRDGEKRNPFFYKKAVLFDYEGESFVQTGYEVVNLEKGNVLNSTGGMIAVENGEYRLEIEGIYSDEDKEYVPRYFAQLYKTGEVIGSMIFIESGFSDINYQEYPERMRLETDEKTAKFCDDSIKMTLALDFEKNTHSLVYAPDDSVIDPEQEPITSPDGKYSIHIFGRYGGGDVVYQHLSLRNNETKEHTYLGTDGGMYGGYNGVGFLKNNDIYIFSGHELRIFDPETVEVKFDINENFPLGYDSETESGRGLLTFRRDPEDFGYIIIYYEYENGIEWTMTERNSVIYEKGSCNYKIGFLDSEGNLLESYDSGIGIASSPFGLEEANLFYIENEKLTVFVSDRRDNPIFAITFDLKTKEFTVA